MYGIFSELFTPRLGQSKASLPEQLFSQFCGLLTLHIIKHSSLQKLELYEVLAQIHNSHNSLRNWQWETYRWETWLGKLVANSNARPIFNPVKHLHTFIRKWTVIRGHCCICGVNPLLKCIFTISSMVNTKLVCWQRRVNPTLNVNIDNLDQV